MENTHPHSDTARRFFVVHNGIIENYRELRAELEKDGVQMRSDTDTEIIAHLIARDTGTTLLERVEHTIERLE